MGRRFALAIGCFLLTASLVHGQITVNTIHVTPAFRQILVCAYINPGNNTQAVLSVTYRAQGTSAWIPAPAGERSTNDPFWLSTVIFGLAESTAYEVHAVVTNPSGVVNGDQTFNVTTRSTVAPSGTGSTYHVSSAGNDTTGDGTSGNPWKSLTRADTVAAPGDTVLVHDGTYTDIQTMTHSGSLAGGYISYIAAPGETPVFDGSDPVYTIPNSGNRFAPVPGRPGVFSTSPGYEPVYVAADADRLYNYAYDENVPLDSLTAGTVTHYGTSYAVAGWLYQSGTLYVHLTGGADPDTVSMHLVQSGTRIQINNADYIALRGLTVRYTAAGIRVRGSHTATDQQPAGRNAWIDSNHLDHINSNGILTTGWTSCSGTVDTDASIGAPGAVLIGNTIQDAANTTAWPWDIKKGTDAENSAFNLNGGDGAIVRENTMHDIFNGVGASNWGDCFWDNFPLESAGMNRNAVIELNTMTDIGDDITEPEGAIINFVMQENKGLRVHTGISMAPIGEGPVWVVRNEVIDYVESCLKFWDGLSVDRGRILIYHNTFSTSLPGGTALLVYPSSDFDVKVKMRNNIFVGAGMPVDAGDPNWGTNVSLDYDAFFSTTNAVPAVMWQYPAQVTCGGGGNNDHCWYDSVSEWIADTLAVGYPQEQNGMYADPLFVDPLNHDLRLSDGSQLIDQGVVITGINDDYMGTAPDRGAYEHSGAPSNDDCVTARIISSTPYTHAMDTTTATTVGSDPAPCAGTGANSVWYRYTPPLDTTITADTFGSAYDTVLSVWTGGCSGPWTAVTCNNDSGGAQSEVSFSAAAGTTYYFLVSDAASGGGALSFHLSINPSYLFFDDFEDGDASDWTHTSGAWTVTAGELTGISRKKADNLAPFAGCSSCSIETTMNAGAGAKASLLAWYMNKKTLVELMQNEPGDRWILKQKNNGATVLKWVIKQPINPNTEYKVAISYDGTQFLVSVDDVVIITTPAAAPVSGNVGFRVKSAIGANATARFQQIAVW